MKAKAKLCPKCERPLEPATLNPQHLWCPICALEFNSSGGPVVHKSAAKPAETAPAPAAAPEAAPAADGEGGPGPQPPEAPQIARFRVTVGAVSFLVHGSTELDVGGTKVRITAL